MAIYISKNHSGITCKELVVCISAMCPVTTITMAYNRVEKEITQNKRVCFLQPKNDPPLQSKIDPPYKRNKTHN